MPKIKTPGKTKGRSGSRRADRSHKRELIGPNPCIRVGLMEEYDRVDFQLIGPFEIQNLEDEVVVENLESDQKWHVVPDKTTEARAVYSILTTAFAKRDPADQLRRNLSQKNHPARVVEVGEEISIDGKQVSNNIKYRVLVGRWQTEREAKNHLDEYRDEFAPRIVRQIIRPSTGILEMFEDDLSSDHLIEDGIRLIPKSPDSKVKLFAVREGTGFHWEREVDRVYSGIIEFRLDPRALLMVLTEIPIEDYLKGVVPAEMPASYPEEALKSQAIAARSEVLSKIGMKHLNDPFDLCATVHCQVYSGSTNHHERTSEAVEATRGEVLIRNDQIVEAVYASCCGGHTENKTNVWNPPEAPHLSGIWDSIEGENLDNDFNLTEELDTEKWVREKPKVWCNAEAFDGLSNILLNSTKYFRWVVHYSRRELEDIIRRKSGEDIGTLINIVPLKRGISGRLMEVDILGEKRNLKVQRELNIRRILSNTYLYSACFTIDVEYGNDGRALNFILTGAGWGHGVGMCQVGAGVMAAKNNAYKEILEHYYPTTTVEKIYGD